MAAMSQDNELKKAFAELQSQMNDTNQRMRIADVQIAGCKKQIVYCNLTDNEMQKLEAEKDLRAFESVGRMFRLTNIPKVRSNLNERVAKSEKKIADLTAGKALLQKSMESSQNNLREMVKLRQETVS